MRLLQERMNPRVSLFQCHTFLSTPLLHFCSILRSSFFPVFFFGGVSFQKMRHCFGALVMTEGELHLFSEAGPRPGGGTTSESSCDGRGRGGFHLSMPPKMKSGTAWSGHSLRKQKIQVEKVWKSDETLKFRWKLDTNFMLIRVFSANFSWFDFPRIFFVQIWCWEVDSSGWRCATLSLQIAWGPKVSDSQIIEPCMQLSFWHSHTQKFATMNIKNIMNQYESMKTIEVISFGTCSGGPLNRRCCTCQATNTDKFKISKSAKIEMHAMFQYACPCRFNNHSCWSFITS